MTHYFDPHPEVAGAPSIGRVLVRDSKDQDGPVLTIESADWRRFADHLKREPATL